MVFPYINMNPPWVYTCSPSWTPLPSPSLYHPSGSSQRTSPKHPVSCIEPGLAIHFKYDIIHVSMPFSQIIPPLPSPTESKRLFYTSVSLLLSHIQGYHYHLSKLHIYVLGYCIGVFLSGLLHSVYAPVSSTSLERTQMYSFNGWGILHCVYVPQLSYPFICWWTSRLFPCPGYRKECCSDHWSTCVFLNYGFLSIILVVGLLGHRVVRFIPSF